MELLAPLLPGSVQSRARPFLTSIDPSDWPLPFNGSNLPTIPVSIAIGGHERERARVQESEKTVFGCFAAHPFGLASGRTELRCINVVNPDLASGFVAKFSLTRSLTCLPAASAPRMPFVSRKILVAANRLLPLITFPKCHISMRGDSIELDGC